MRHPIPKDIGEFLEVDKNSETGLRWLKNVGSRAKAGAKAGYKGTQKGCGKETYRVRFNGITYLNHRIIYFLETGVDPENLDIDHKNGNSADNSPFNLRIATHTENLRNSKLHKNNTSGFKGVSWDKPRGKWLARIRIGKQRKYLGIYEEVEEAARAYDRAALEHFGEFAWLNFPENHST